MHQRCAQILDLPEADVRQKGFARWSCRRQRYCNGVATGIREWLPAAWQVLERNGGQGRTEMESKNLLHQRDKRRARLEVAPKVGLALAMEPCTIRLAVSGMPTRPDRRIFTPKNLRCSLASNH